MKVNQNLKMPTKGRKALACPLETFIDIYTSLLQKANDVPEEEASDFASDIADNPCIGNLEGKITSDTDIEFDLENLFYGWVDGEDNFAAACTEVDIDGKSVPMVKFYAGGDWEYPVCFVAYLDDKKNLRFYSPRPGNTFNPLNKKAFGNGDNAWFSDEEGDDDDDKFAKSIGLEEYADLEDSLEPDTDLMIKAIQARFIAC